METNKVKFSVALQSDAYKKLINNTLGNEECARQFVADISAVVSNNGQLQSCDHKSIISAGLVAQTLKLPLSSALGFAYVVPYNTKTGWKAQFQVGWKGLVQLAIRTGQYERIGVKPVHKGEVAGQDEFGDDIVKFNHECDNNETVGYFAYFKLVNGFIKTLYWTKNQCEQHAHKYSRAYGNGSDFDNWTKMFDLMAQKTVLKQLLSKYGIMSVELQKAVVADQAVVNDGKYEYVDNEKPSKTNVDNKIAATPDGEVIEANQADL